MNIIYSIHCRKEVTRWKSKHKKRSLKGDYDRFAAEVVVAAPRRIKNCIEKSFLSARADFPKGGNVWDKKRSLGNWLLLFLKNVGFISMSLFGVSTIFSPRENGWLTEKKNVWMKILMYAANFSAFVILLWWGWQLWSGGFKVHLFFPFFASTRMSTFNGVGDE